MAALEVVEAQEDVEVALNLGGLDVPVLATLDAEALVKSVRSCVRRSHW